ncbi:hypothetical protein MTO96_035876, partial [Rhipicephalus appendiculatus]
VCRSKLLLSEESPFVSSLHLNYPSASTLRGHTSKGRTLKPYELVTGAGILPDTAARHIVDNYCNEDWMRLCRTFVKA